jgi:hypothetical protein
MEKLYLKIFRKNMKNLPSVHPLSKKLKSFNSSYYRAWLSSLYLSLQVERRMKVATGRSRASAFNGVHAYCHWAIVELYYTLFRMSKTALRLCSLTSATDEFATDLIHIYSFCLRSPSSKIVLFFIREEKIIFCKLFMMAESSKKFSFNFGELFFCSKNFSIWI